MKISVRQQRLNMLAEIKDFLREVNGGFIPLGLCIHFNKLAKHLGAFAPENWAIPRLTTGNEEEAKRLTLAGLTEEQAKRIIEIRDLMSRLNTEALEIVKPTDQEKQQSIDCYMDEGHDDLAELLVDSWGNWEDILMDRVMEKESAEES